MSALRIAIMLVIAGSATHALAEQITCESHHDAAEACGTVQRGSEVRVARQLSSSPCIQGRTWDSSDDSIWVSRGCRAVFEVTPPDRRDASDNSARYGHDDDRRAQPRYAEQDEQGDDDTDEGSDKANFTQRP